jgi:cytochrome c-type biogenesis protein CcmH/NrfG
MQSKIVAALKSAMRAPAKRQSTGVAGEATTIFARDHEAARAAVRRFMRLLRANGDDANAWHALGMAQTRLGDRAAACAAFHNAVRLDTNRIHSQLALGNLLFDSGRLEHALRCFELARRLTNNRAATRSCGSR